MKMISLASLRYRDTIEKIAYKDPKLLYYICYKGNPDDFPIKYPLVDEQEDCKELSRFNIFDYEPPYERDTHRPEPSCKFTNKGKKIFKELVKKKACKEMLKFFTEKNITENGETIEMEIPIDKEVFRDKFEDIFTFSQTPSDTLTIKYNEFKEKYNYLSFPDRGHGYSSKGCQYSFDCVIEHNRLFFIITILCNCSKRISKMLSEEDFQEWGSYKVTCENCGK
jgi:hypothetical protein